MNKKFRKKEGKEKDKIHATTVPCNNNTYTCTHYIVQY